MISIERSLSAAVLVAGVVGCVAAEEAKQVQAPQRTPVDYKCIFNHELLIISHKKDNNAEYIKDFVRKFKGTDVDAIMCCPEMWRTNTFPSEVDPTWKKYKPGQPKSKFASWDYMMTYLHEGGDPVKDTLEACREIGVDFFISYRMNDHHYVQDKEWPCHNDFWRDHPEYWLADSDTSPYKKSRDDVRLHNYMLPEVRDYYYAIIQELCTNYDVDGVEFDFQRFPRFFKNDEVEEGTKVMTAFVVSIRKMLDRIGAERGKYLKLCARVPHTIELCEEAGLDIVGWDAAGLFDMINVSSSYFHTMEMDIEGFQARTGNAKIYAEMNYVTNQNSKASKFARRYTTIPIYRATALNFFARGADGLSLFNWDYVPSNTRMEILPGLRQITDVEFLRTTAKDYAVYPFFGAFKKPNEETVELIIPDDTSKVHFESSVLRVETRENCEDLRIGVWFNDRQLEECEHKDVELFPALAQNEGYPTAEVVKFYTVPLDAVIPGKNTIRMENLDKEKRSCKFFSLEIALYR